MTEYPLNINSPFFHEERYATLAPHASGLISICGAGALGGNLAETLARMGCTHLRLIDKDRVDMRNLSAQPYSRAEIGAPKARALATALYRAVQAKVEPVGKELTTANALNLLSGSTLVVDAFDNHLARAAVSQAARCLQWPCLHIGFSSDGLYGSGVWEPDYRVPRETPGDPCDYPLTRPFALALSALAARAITDFLLQGARYDFEMTWHDLHIHYAVSPAADLPASGPT
jgi:hypothetical protein